MKHTFEKAVITSINKTTGRVGLFLRNGLETYGVYLYDLNDLYVGMTVLVGLMNGAYVIFQNMSSNTPVVATKSYSKSANYSMGLACIDYIESDIPQWNDDFSGDEYGDDIDTNKWVLSSTNPTAPYFCNPANSLDLCFNPWVYYGHYEYYEDPQSNLKIIDGKLLYDKFYYTTDIHDNFYYDVHHYNKLWSGTISQYSAPGDFSVTFKLIMMKNKVPHPHYSMSAIYSYITSYGGFYDVSATILSDLLSAITKMAETYTIFVKFERVGIVWNFYMRSSLSDPWLLQKTMNDSAYLSPDGPVKLFIGFQNSACYIPETEAFANNFALYAQYISIGVFCDYILPESWWVPPFGERLPFLPSFFFRVMGWST